MLRRTKDHHATMSRGEQIYLKNEYLSLLPAASDKEKNRVDFRQPRSMMVTPSVPLYFISLSFI